MTVILAATRVVLSLAFVVEASGKLLCLHIAEQSHT